MIIYNVNVVKVESKYSVHLDIFDLTVEAPTFSALQYRLYEEMDKQEINIQSPYRIIFKINESK
jgi:hypothetical protein